MYCVALLSLTLLGLVEAQLANINKGEGELSIRLLQATVKDNENTIHSVYSIASALGMCLLGAQGTTLTSMKSTMGIAALSDADVKAGFKKSTEQLSLVGSAFGDGFVINTANRIYVNKTFSIATSYISDVDDVFQAGIETVDFYGNAEGVKDDINDFVSDNTHGLIPNILTSTLPKETLMALVNALYFKGNWALDMYNSTSTERFNAHLCYSFQVAIDPAPVSMAATRINIIPDTIIRPLPLGQAASWIRKKDRYKYVDSSDLEASLVELPYTPNNKSSDATSMIIIFPHDKHKCNISGWVKSKLEWNKIVSAIQSMTRVMVNVTIPRMKVESKYELSSTLAALGMGPAFSSGANFNLMSGSGTAGIQIDQVIHQAKMVVDEKGTTAAAATVIVMTPNSAIDGPVVQMFVNRSFVALIILRQEGGDSIVPLFSSVVNKP